MDDPAIDQKSHEQALRGLQRINRVTNSTRMIWRSILEHQKNCSGPVRVLDLACGGGDVLIDLACRAKKKSVELELTGWDLSPTAIEVTNRLAAKHAVPVQTQVANALTDRFPVNQDVIFCSLFLHHLTDEEAEHLLIKMAEATAGVLVVSDLLRNRFGYSIAWLGTRVLSRSRVVHVDGPRSVEAAFSLQEVRELTTKCNLQGADLKSFFPGRFLLQWSKTHRDANEQPSR